MSDTVLRGRLIRLAHARPDLRADLLPLLTDKAACGWGGGEAPVMAKFEEGKSVDPTQNMSEEDAAEWKRQHALHKDQFKQAAVSDGHGPSSDGKYYHVSLMHPQAATNGTGPWLVASIRGVPNSGFAVPMSKSAMERMVRDVRQVVGRDWNEAHKLMYERSKQLPNQRKYDPQWGTIEGITPIEAQG
jgi:hypothetical protein